MDRSFVGKPRAMNNRGLANQHQPTRLIIIVLYDAPSKKEYGLPLHFDAPDSPSPLVVGEG